MALSFQLFSHHDSSMDIRKILQLVFILTRFSTYQAALFGGKKCEIHRDFNSKSEESKS